MNKLFTTGARSIIIVASLFLLLGLQQVAQAQPMRMSPEQRAKMLKDSLSLTDDQTAKVTKILEDQQVEMMARMSEATGDREAMRKAMQEVAAETDKQIEALLTKEQLKKYEAMKKQRQQMRQRMMPRREG